MRVGLVSDIHANLPALEAVFDDMASVDKVVCAGDVVGYNPWPAECVELVREVADIVVRGNHDRTVETPERYQANHMAMAGLELAKERCSADQLDWITGLPRKSTFADGQYLVVHDHPETVDEYVYPRDFPRVRPHLDDFDGAVLGHTHVQHEATIDGRVITNPGSIGQPRDEDPRAAYGVLDTEAGEVALHRVKYDINRVINRVEELGLPEQTGTRLLDGT